MAQDEHMAAVLFIGAAALTIVGASLLSLAIFGAAIAQGILWGWLLTLIHGAAAFWIDRRAIGLDVPRFMLQGMGLHLLRLAVLITILFATRRFGMSSYGPFVICVLWGYLVFMSAEVWHLHLRTMRGVTPRRGTGG